MAKELNIDKEVLDGSPSSLSEVSAAMRWNVPEGIHEKVALSLIAYAGEVIQKKTKGSWEIRLDEETNIWVPAIREPNGKSHILSLKTLESMFLKKGYERFQTSILNEQ